MPNRPPTIRRKLKPKASTNERLSPHRRGYNAEWQKTRRRIFTRDKGQCQHCGKVLGKAREAHIDHITPKAAGGTNADENLQLLCDACHGVKTRAEDKAGLLKRPAGRTRAAQAARGGTPNL